MPADVQFDSPRAVADKSRKKALVSAIRLALGIESAAVRHNTQTFNRGRYAAVSILPDYDALKDRARAIKEDAIARSPELLAQLEKSVRARGGKFYLAPDAADARRYIAEICRRVSARIAVKGKSMTSEEVGLNHELEAAGVEVVETDLAEFILQAADEQPSHVIAPAIHYSRERITDLFHRVFNTSEPLETGEDLTRFARERLREKFLAAGVGITGANFVVAADGSLVLVESEANIRMATIMPPLHIAIAGIENVVPARGDLAPFIELLAASATGQPMSSYTSILRPPLLSPVLTDDGTQPAREFHLVLVDNGRNRMRDDPVLREALYCIRCSACLNSCANFQTVGGHAFGGETYSGGIGGSWEAGTHGLPKAKFSELCTGCSRCVNQCPVRIDIPWLNTVLRQRLAHENTSAPTKLRDALAGVPAEDAGMPLSKIFFGRFDLSARLSAPFAPMVNAISANRLARAGMEKFFGVSRHRTLPAFARETMVDLARSRPRSTSASPVAKVALLADVFTNYTSPDRGLATLEILERLGVDVAITPALPDGRAALSQGLIATASAQAQSTAQALLAYLAEGRELVVVEPSVLAMFRLDNRHLLDDAELMSALREHSFDAIEFISRVLRLQGRSPAEVFPAAKASAGTRLFYHSHCQQRTIGAAAATVDLLTSCGFDVATSSVECCGMAGSFGYKKDYYDLSMAVGADLANQVRAAEQDGPRALVATGTSCQEQLHSLLNRPVLHPAQLLRATLAGSPVNGARK
ncbi:MAG: LUD domain-containing protein [Terriglobales bacterium]